MNKQLFKDNGNNKFPVSTDTLDFMQEQIFLAYKLAALAGGYVIIQNSTASREGLCIYNGELMPLKGAPDTCIIPDNHAEDITANGETFRGVRVTHYAQYAPAGGTPATAFWTLTNLQTLKAQLDAAAQHHVPTGAIMMWSGTIANIPTGWALCNGQNGTPDLRGRFIVGATNGIVMFDSKGYNYAVGATGGKNEVALTVDQMPKHNHDTASSISDGTVSTGSGGAHTHKGAYKSYQDGSRDYGWPYISQSSADGTHEVPWGDGDSGLHSHSISLKARGNGQAHENRPVFYALAFIMKVI